jgi:hypothetical protein
LLPGRYQKYHFDITATLSKVLEKYDTLVAWDYFNLQVTFYFLQNKKKKKKKKKKKFLRMSSSSLMDVDELASSRVAVQFPSASNERSSSRSIGPS